MIRRNLVALLLTGAALLAGTPAAGQSLRDVLNSMFVFGGSGDALFLGGSGGVPSTQVHGAHFIPSESEANASLLTFLNQTIARNVANFPLSSTVASQTFTFVGGVPTLTSNSFGPILAERGQTLGAGRFNAGLNYSRLRFSSLRGVPLDRVQLTFVHENSDFPNCDVIFGGDCSEYGFPIWEHDRITLDLDLRMEAEVYAFYVTFGLTDWLDIGFAAPVVDFRLDGLSTAKILPADGLPALHFFGGTPTAPILEAERRNSGRSSGIGDIATRMKARILRGEALDIALLGELRLPTGREDDFLGSGSLNARGLFIGSATFADFSPHVNIGFAYRGADLDQHVVELITGFDHRLSGWATLAVDVLGAFRLGDEKVGFPDPVIIPASFRQEVQRTNIPMRRDDVVDGSFGFKFRSGGGLTIITNVLVPLNTGGLRSAPIPTLGLEFAH
jgi:hypothetical protein